jgi:hypothetical protein
MYKIILPIQSALSDIVLSFLYDGTQVCAHRRIPPAGV